jgi:hypothetical protein
MICDDVAVLVRGRKPETLCDLALKRARRQLAVRHGARFSSAFWYGAVNIAPEHLTVWVLLQGDPADLPEWYFPPQDQQDGPYAQPLLADLEDMREIVIACFTRAGWANPERVNVGFDSETRVVAGGGWHYFR